jgi:hypothetical protein
LELPNEPRQRISFWEAASVSKRDASGIAIVMDPWRSRCPHEGSNARPVSRARAGQGQGKGTEHESERPGWSGAAWRYREGHGRVALAPPVGEGASVVIQPGHQLVKGRRVLTSQEGEPLDKVGALRHATWEGAGSSER